MSRILRLRSFRKRWASRVSSLFSCIRLPFNIVFLNWSTIDSIAKTYKFDKLSRSSSKSFGRKSKLFFDRSKTLRWVSPRKESLCSVDNWFDERSLKTAEINDKIVSHQSKLTCDWCHSVSIAMREYFSSSAESSWFASKRGYIWSNYLIKQSKTFQLVSSLSDEITDKSQSLSNDPKPGYRMTSQFSTRAARRKTVFVQSSKLYT